MSLILVGCSKNELKLLNEYPHNKESFTQGLFVYDGELYETTGLYGKSKLYKNINLNNLSYEKEYTFDSKYFVEGSTIYKDKIYVLTWKEKKVFVFDKDNLNLIKELDYFTQGWGLCTDNDYLIASDGSDKLYYMDEDLNIIKTLNVTYNDFKIDKLNELEFINGYIWANRFTYNDIYIINPSDGKVIKVLNFNEFSKEYKDKDDVLNGIAYKDNKVYITGKRWNKIYEFDLQ